MKRRPLSAVVLAAGQGRRLAPITLTHSKAMTPILGRPIVLRVIDSLRQAGVDDFVVVAAPQDRELIAALQRIPPEHLTLRLAYQAERKGTGHALKQAADLIPGDFILASCDNLYPGDFLQNLVRTFQENSPAAVIALAPLESESLAQAAGVKLQGERVIELREKPGPGSGQWDAVAKFLFAVSRQVLNFLDAAPVSRRGEIEFQDALLQFLNTRPGPALGCMAHRHLHLTSVSDLIAIHEHYLQCHRPFIIHPEAKVDPGVTMIHPVMVDRGARIRSGARLGPVVYVGEGAMIEPNAELEQCVVYAGARVAEGSRHQQSVILG
jgi:NDP-sugar pyrophosphorylase family protein